MEFIYGLINSETHENLSVFYNNEADMIREQVRLLVDGVVTYRSVNFANELPEDAVVI